jgi:hypothetical protein
MTFVERMKQLLDQGVQVSKDFATKAGATAKDLGAKAGPIAQDLGHKAKDLGAKAGAKAQDLGERGVLMFEIRQLEGQAQKLIGRLGAEAYQTFAERGETTVSAESAPIKAMLAEIATIRASIEEKQADLKSRKGK